MSQALELGGCSSVMLLRSVRLRRSLRSRCVEGAPKVFGDDYIFRLI